MNKENQKEINKADMDQGEEFKRAHKNISKTMERIGSLLAKQNNEEFAYWIQRDELIEGPYRIGYLKYIEFWKMPDDSICKFITSRKDGFEILSYEIIGKMEE